MSYDRLIKYSVLALIICIIAYFAYSLISGYYQEKIETAKIQEQKNRQKQLEQVESLKEEVSDLEVEIKELKGQKSPKERTEKLFGSRSSLLSLEEKSLSFEEIEELVKAFFSYIDENGYIENNNLTGTAYNQYDALIHDLSADVPFIAGETENLYNLFQNTAHFFRVLDKERVSLVKDILTEESDITEYAMKLFYMWYTYENDNGERIKDNPSLQVLYDYAGFFLNTLGGKSYLLRRDSRVRILTNFYSLLIIDIANDNKLNSNGIDIRPHLKTTINDITDYMGMIDKREYLNVLERLEAKYNMP